MALEASRRDLCIDAPLGVCTFPIAEEIGSEIHPRGRVVLRVVRYDITLSSWSSSVNTLLETHFISKSFKACCDRTAPLFVVP